MKELINKVSAFFGDVNAEIKKISWPKNKELVGSTAVVLSLILIMSIWVGLSDKVLTYALKLVMKAITPQY